MSDSVNWDFDMSAVVTGLDGVESRLQASIKLICDTVAKKMESWAKDNAIWVNRTTNARQGLSGEAIWKDSDTIWICVAHSVDYGVWLELANERRYAILEASIEANKDELIRALKKLF